MNLVKRIIYRAFQNRGYEIIRRKGRIIVVPNFPDDAFFERNRFIFDYLLDNQLLFLIEKLEINCVLDVGANIGQFAQKLRRSGYNGYLVSFEPVQETYKKLKETSGKDPKWHVYPYALGSKDSTAEINITASSVLSSFYHPNAHCDEFGATEAAKIIRKETVDIRRLDSVIEEVSGHIDDARFFLKMDTQGHDLDVFNGAGECLDRIFGLQSELAVIPIYEDIKRMNDIIIEYESHGYEVAGFFPVNWDKKTLRVIEFDCVMVKSGLRNP